MYLSSSLLIVALAGFAQAQTPSNFTPQVNTKLEVIFNSTMVNTPGQTLTKAGKFSSPLLAQTNLIPQALPTNPNSPYQVLS